MSWKCHHLKLRFGLHYYVSKGVLGPLSAGLMQGPTLVTIINLNSTLCFLCFQCFFFMCNHPDDISVTFSFVSASVVVIYIGNDGL